MAKWMVAAKKADFKQVAEQYHISVILARLIRNRDITEDMQIERYLYGNIDDLYDPHKMMDMDKAASILKERIDSRKPIRIIGDYDVDGICSAYILASGIKFLGGVVSCALPDRIHDGYGLNENLITSAIQDGTDTILTCDNGIAAVTEIAFAKKQGMTVVVTDHHEVPVQIDEDGNRNEILPAADAIVDPKRTGDHYLFSEICGAVVAYKLVQVLLEQKNGKLPHTEEEKKKLMNELLEFAALATVCDVMELKDENRIVVREGIKQMQQSGNRGLKALIHVNGLEEKKINCYHLGFILGPCLNATGRLDSAARALNLLMTESREEAAAIAGDLKALNDSRKEMTAKCVAQAVAEVGKNQIMPKVLVIYLPECHEAIAGIVAGRIREKYGRPTLILTDAEDGIKGSARSIPAYDMYQELSACSALFSKFGGHKMAAGLSMQKEDIELLLEKLNASCTLKEDDFQEVLHIDMEMPLLYANEKLIREMSLLEPFGNGNTRPVFAVRNVKLLSGRIMGKNQNCAKYKIMDENGMKYDMIYFGDMNRWISFLIEKYGIETERKLNSGMYIEQENTVEINMAYYPDINCYQGRESVQIVMTDFL